MSTKKRPSFLATLTWVDWLLTAVAIGAIGYGVVRARDLDPERWSYVAGPLFALSSGFLFILALRVQLREHRQAIEEMEQANVNHAELARIAKQEKEFNACLKAYRDLLEDTDAYNEQGEHGMAGLRSIARQWVKAFTPDRKGFCYIHDHYITGYGFANLPLQYYSDIESILLRIQWLIAAIRNKELDTRDREYLHVLCKQLVRDVNAAIDEQLDLLIRAMTALSEEPSIIDAGNADKLIEQRKEWIEVRLKGGMTVMRDQMIDLNGFVQAERAKHYSPRVNQLS